jgi:uncharacterized protein (TIGR02678 family)
MITHGLLLELHDHIDRYGADDRADAVLRIRADRIALIALAGLGDASSADDLLAMAQDRGTSRQQMRARLANDPVIYRADLTPDHWAELRRRLGEESAILDEVLGLELEARAEGVAAIDPAGSLSDRRFPSGGTESHAALLLIDRLVETRSAPDRGESQSPDFLLQNDHNADWLTRPEVVELIDEISTPHRSRWRSEYVDNLGRLADDVVGLLADLRLVEQVPDEDGTWRAKLLPAAARFTSAAGGVDDNDPEAAHAAGSGEEQSTLW